MASPPAALAKVRALCLSFPETSERISHGAPTFYVKEKRSFVQFHDDHHGDGKLALWCAAPPDAQAMLVDSDPDVFYVPAYVGHLGWVGVRLDRKAPWAVVARVIEEAYGARAAKPAAKKAAPRAAKPATPRAARKVARPR